MCYRYSNAQEETEFRRHMKSLGRVFRQDIESGKKFFFYHSNGFSHEQLPVITQEKPDDLTWKYWGLIPTALKSRADKDKYWKMGFTLNAREEEITKTWSFKYSIRERRCLVPATGFFEWRDFKGIKYPYLIQVKASKYPDETEPFCFAGIYDRWEDKVIGDVIESFALITTEANYMMKQVHVNLTRPDQGGRMPVILPPKDYGDWLNPDTKIEDVQAMLQPYDEEKMEAYTISKQITSRKVDPNNPETLKFTPYSELGAETAFNLSSSDYTSLSDSPPS